MYVLVFIVKIELSYAVFYIFFYLDISDPVFSCVMIYILSFNFLLLVL